MAHFPNVSANNIAILSLGAGSYPRHTNVMTAGKGLWVEGNDAEMELARADWGIKQWIPFLLDLLLDGDTVTTEMVMHYLLGRTGLYHRLDPALPRLIRLDEVRVLCPPARCHHRVSFFLSLNVHVVFSSPSVGLSVGGCRWRP